MSLVILMGFLIRVFVLCVLMYDTSRVFMLVMVSVLVMTWVWLVMFGVRYLILV